MCRSCRQKVQTPIWLYEHYQQEMGLLFAKNFNFPYSRLHRTVYNCMPTTQFITLFSETTTYHRSITVRQPSTEYWPKRNWMTKLLKRWNSQCIIVEHHLTDMVQGTVTCFMCIITFFSEIKKNTIILHCSITLSAMHWRRAKTELKTGHPEALKPQCRIADQAKP